MYYVLASPFLYNLLSYTRYDVVKNPIDSNFKRTEYVHKIILAGCTFSLLFATLSVTQFWLNMIEYLLDSVTPCLIHPGDSL